MSSELGREVSAGPERTFNPYQAPAEAAEQAPAQATHGGPFYLMSPVKLFVMCVLTFGLYQLLFHYRHWKHRQRADDDVVPWARALFAPFYLFGLVSRIRVERILSESETPDAGLALAAAAPVYFMATLTERISSRIELGDGLTEAVVFTATSLVTAGALYVVQHHSNVLVLERVPQATMNRGITVGSAVFGTLGAALWASAWAWGLGLIE